jgi:hypothetical protein
MKAQETFILEDFENFDVFLKGCGACGSKIQKHFFVCDFY